MSRRAIVCGGSIGGLFAATALMARGWEVDVFERTDMELAGRGAGIVTHDVLISALKSVGADLRDLGVEVTERVAFDMNGARVQTRNYSQIVTSWDRIHQILRAKIPKGRYHLGMNVTGYHDKAASTAVMMGDGTYHEADLIVGADGFRSAIRAQFQPDILPQYAGYVVWRALADEADIPPSAHEALFDPFGFFLPMGTQVIGYPIAGKNNDLRHGHRRYNFVWYAKASQSDLDYMLTDGTGTRHDISIPPPLVRKEVLDRMEADARQKLPRPFLDILAVSERPFFTPIYDHLAPVMGQGRIALAGDAACVARPHVGMGVTKAALDALALARHLQDERIDNALTAYSKERVVASQIAYARGQVLGTYIFAEPTAGDNQDGRNNPNLDAIMTMTAVVP